MCEYNNFIRKRFAAGSIRGTRVVKFQQDAVQLDLRKLSELVIVPEQQCEPGEQCVSDQRCVRYPDGIQQR